MNKIKPVFLFIILSTIFIFFSYQSICAETKLRNSPKKLNDQELKTCVQKYNFFDKIYNAQGDFANDFIDNKDDTITDRMTGLMWEKGGSKKPKTWYYVKKYIKKLNKKKFAGYNDWRLPTVEELYSLLESNQKNNLYIDPVFVSKPVVTCWSIDKSKMTNSSPISQGRKLLIDYREGSVAEAWTGRELGGASPHQIWSTYIRAVRTIK